MENHLIWEDVELEVRDEERRRNKFFSGWQSEKGADANYKNLINALLVIGCRRDAEYVCGLLKKIETMGGSGGKQNTLFFSCIARENGDFRGICSTVEGIPPNSQCCHGSIHDSH